MNTRTVSLDPVELVTLIQALNSKIGERKRFADEVRAVKNEAFTKALPTIDRLTTEYETLRDKLVKEHSAWLDDAFGVDSRSIRASD